MKYTTNVGDLVVIWITGMLGSYIAEVTQSKPLRLKVEESGPLAHLKEHGDFGIKKNETIVAQMDEKYNTCNFVKEEQEAGRRVISGLKRMGVNDGKLHEILPGDS